MKSFLQRDCITVNSQQQWYLLYCKPKQELKAQQHLANQGLTSFVPQMTVEKLRAGKWQLINEPLFPRYLFLQILDPEQLNIRAIRATRGIVDFVRFGQSLARVPASLIQLLTEQQLLQQQQPQTQRLHKGQPVSIASGPYSGLDAVFNSADGEKRSLILISLLGQWVEASIENAGILAKKAAGRPEQG
jgi:transcriptional antiterminator RfaH